MIPFFQNIRTLGQATGPRTYDLALEKSAGTLFIVVLFAVMTYLAILSAAGAAGLFSLSAHYAGGLQNRASIEIPAEDKNGAVIPADKLSATAEKVRKILSAHPAVETVKTVPRDEIAELVSPWLGDAAGLSDLPLPAIISVTFQDGSDIDLSTLSARIHAVAPAARMETHQNWLAAVMQFTGTLKAIAIAVLFLIGGATMIAVSGAISSKIAIHTSELELIHLMGATDSYLSQQFEKYAFRLSLRGAAVGLGLSLLTFFAIYFLMQASAESAIFPALTPGIGGIVLMVMVPVLLILAAVGTARITALRALSRMP